ncbi:hypothetical protein OROGR_020038 [Orobanche gracilis]
MEFWGVEVKSGEQLKVKPKYKRLIHISQATLGESKKGNEGGENIPLRLRIDDKNFIMGALSDGRAQVMFDLVIQKEFELSHDWKNGSVYFMGYVADEVDSDDDDDDDCISDSDEDSDKEVHLGQLENGNAATADAAMNKEDSDDDDTDDASDDESEDSDESESSDGDDLSGEDDEEDNSSEEELPIPPKKSKKRPAESVAQPTPASTKKAKSPAPDKTGNKKIQNATPFPSKAAGKKPKHSPKSMAEFSAKSGNKFSDSKNSKNGKGKQRGGK